MDQEETKKNEPWYEVVEPSERLTQGDIILQCPLVGWKPALTQVEGLPGNEVLKGATDIFTDDVIVMTQACDLENKNVSNVVLCPCSTLTAFRQSWEEERKIVGKSISSDAWRSVCRSIANGFNWNLSMLNSYADGHISTEHRVVDFHEVFTVPLDFIESFLKQKDQKRLRLRPPYREHLAQAFARFFMRVGLPSSVTPVWEKQAPASR